MKIGSKRVQEEAKEVEQITDNYANPHDTTDKYENNYYRKIKDNYRDFMDNEDKEHSKYEDEQSYSEDTERKLVEIEHPDHSLEVRKESIPKRLEVNIDEEVMQETAPTGTENNNNRKSFSDKDLNESEGIDQIMNI